MMNLEFIVLSRLTEGISSEGRECEHEHAMDEDNYVLLCATLPKAT